MAGSEQRFVFGPLEQRIVLLGLRLGQVAVLAAWVVFVLVVIWSLPTPANVFAAMVLSGSVGVVAFVPVAGRTLEEWAPIVALWAAGRLSGRHRFRSAMPRRGHRSDGTLHLDLPPTLASMEIVAVPVGPGQDVGVLVDRRADTYTALLAVTGDAFPLLESGEQHRLLQAWDEVLRSLGGEASPVHRLQWVERTVPDDGDALGRDLRDRLAAPKDAPWVRSYLEVLDEAGPVSTQHETLLALQVCPRRLRRLTRRPGETHQQAACRLLIQQVVLLHQRLMRADLKVIAGGLTPRMVARALRTAVDPVARTTAARMHEDGGIDPAQAWPLAADTAWSTYHTDSGWHTTFWIAEWPRTPVGPDFLAPLLLLSSVSRTVAVTLEPVGTFEAIRQVEQHRTTELAEQEVREARGFLTSYRKRREQEALNRRATELHDGYADFRFAGHVTVTAATLEELDDACAQVLHAAGQSGLDLRRMTGCQDLAFTYTLPLARGL